VLSMTEATQDPHLAARQTYQAPGGVTQPAPAPRFSRTPPALGPPPPLPGEHTRAAMTDWGIGNIDSLIAAGVLRELDGS
jgi:alpha-methylacyl-CoA racemase